ncbi:hypothetical protein N658DRAFT_493769 [Parathielavia hyrcaniae]|uniref:Integral membrane protein n=1 Tax=Parathielavia hyrcaniae TaxID=113614 RepID=A0AAN6QB76_9PEZI|nr:hypothetical protein N658DRAFT_493769 [Parathielavia hyrcaniae]
MLHPEALVPVSDELHPTGPFPFLHPTTRYHPITLRRTQHQQQQHDRAPRPSTTINAAGEWGFTPDSTPTTTTAPTTTPTPTPTPTTTPTTPPTTTGDPTKHARQVYHVWKSRDNRKGRHRAVIMTPTRPSSHASGTARGEQGDEDDHLGGHGASGRGGDEGDQHILYPRQVKKTLLGLAKLVTRFPVWDVSYLVAVAFVLGSVVWCINGCFIWLPLVAPQSEFPGETESAAGILAFIGATIFEVGSVLMVLEATNAERSDCFGWALEESLEDHGLRLLPRHETCRHHHRRGRRALLKDSAAAAMAATVVKSVAEPGGLEERKGDDEKVRAEMERRWLWWPTWHEFKTHYIREIGFLGSFIQLLGATIFWISGFTALPPIYNALSLPLVTGVYWVPQVVGGTGFIVSGVLFMVEVQDKWYKPAFKTLGWHVGFWNLLGGIGFTLCPAAGFGSEASLSLEHASALSTFIGSWAFLIGSVAQWYESLDKYPLSVVQSPSWLQLGEKVV